MSEPQCPVAMQLLELARGLVTDAVAAYLVAWAALENVARVQGERSGVRARFVLHQNGVLRVRKIGTLKMPEVIPPRDEHLLSIALQKMALEARDALIVHPATLYLAERVPVLDGHRVTSDAYHQHPHGVLDVGATLDPRYPVWSFIDAELLRRYAGGGRTAEAGERLLSQIAEVLATIHRNLLGATGSHEGEANGELASRALPLLTTLVESLLNAGPTSKETPC